MRLFISICIIFLFLTPLFANNINVTVEEKEKNDKLKVSLFTNDNLHQFGLGYSRPTGMSIGFKNTEDTRGNVFVGDWRYIDKSFSFGYKQQTISSGFSAFNQLMGLDVARPGATQNETTASFTLANMAYGIKHTTITDKGATQSDEYAITAGNRFITTQISLVDSANKNISRYKIGANLSPGLSANFGMNNDANQTQRNFGLNGYITKSTMLGIGYNDINDSKRNYIIRMNQAFSKNSKLDINYAYDNVNANNNRYIIGFNHSTGKDSSIVVSVDGTTTDKDNTNVKLDVRSVF